jgi:hypothetical protein
VGLPPGNFWVLAKSASSELDDHKKSIRFFTAFFAIQSLKPNPSPLCF